MIDVTAFSVRIALTERSKVGTDEKNDALNEKTLHILGILSESVLREKDLFYDAEEIWDDLLHRGYSEREIEDALAHIERISLEVPGAFWSEHLPCHRSYTAEEMSRLPPKVRGYLWKLKSRGIIDHALEDEIVQKAMNLEEPAGIREIKTVAALTVFGYEHRGSPKQRALEGCQSPLLN
jgi:uncharacterized protein Smg (DUF494 family)